MPRTVFSYKINYFVSRAETTLGTMVLKFGFTIDRVLIFKSNYMIKKINVTKKIFHFKHVIYKQGISQKTDSLSFGNVR
jgi:hypothetical protein